MTEKLNFLRFISMSTGQAPPIEMKTSSSDVTPLLNQVAAGDKDAEQRLFFAVETELRRIAEAKMRRERANHSLRPTDLVDEVFVQLVRQKTCWNNRRHFYGTAALAMRRLLTTHWRKKSRRDNLLKRQDIDVGDLANGEDRAAALAINEMLDDLKEQYPERAEVVELRVFSGLTFDQIAKCLSRTPKQVRALWEKADLWMKKHMKDE